MMNVLIILATAIPCCGSPLLTEVRAVDERADAAVAGIASVDGLRAKQAEWRAKWLAGIGGLPSEKTPLNAKEGPVVKCDGFTLQNVLFESLPGVYVVGHLCLPDRPDLKPPYPVVMMPLGHSDCGILAPRYAAHLAAMARAGFAAFAWDPVAQGERRQCAAKFDPGFSECASEHSRLGARGWLVGWNFARFRIWDAIRAVDYAETRRDLDCSKLGVCGTSGGGTMSAYMQALDDRIKVAFPNCYISSFREVFDCRGCHDSEQFYFNQLNDGVNHAAILAMGLGRVELATGSRYDDYFPHRGAVETFAVYSNLAERITVSTIPPSTPPILQTSKPPNLQTSQHPIISPFHFHCAGPHGLPPPTRAAQVDWMTLCIKGGPALKPLAEYQALGGTNPRGLAGNGIAADPSNHEPIPYATNDTFMAGGYVRNLQGFKSLYTLLAERATALRAARRSAPPKTREQLREIVRRRANIRPLAELEKLAGTTGVPPVELEPFDHPKFSWWYLKGPYGVKRENEAAMMAVLGRSVVGRDAERIILKRIQSSTPNLQPSTLKASGYDCIAAAHAYAAEPQLWSGIELENPPPSWTEMVVNPDPAMDSYAVGVWGALEEYDWTELLPPENLPGQGVGKLADGKLNPTCAWKWKGNPIEVETDFAEEREIGGVRFWAGRSWISCGPRKASFYARTSASARLPLGTFEFRPAHTFKQSYATWPKVKCRGVTMVIEETWETVGGYYMWYMRLSNPLMQKLFDTPPYTLGDPGDPKVEIAELDYFGDEPADLPKPNADGATAYPDSRLVFDWMLQSCAVSNISHVASVERDTTKPDPLGEDVGAWLERNGRDARCPSDARVECNGRDARCPSDAWRKEREAKRREFLKYFREKCPEFIYVKHLVIGNSIMHATDDMTDASYLEWKSVPDYHTGSQLIRARINEDGSVTQQVLIDAPDGIIRDPSLSVDAKYVVVSKRSSMEKDNYHLWRYDLGSGQLSQLTFEPTLPRELVPGQKHDFPLVCADTEPCVLPDGSIVFQSTRVCHSVDCWPLPTTNLYKCDPDGRNIRRIGFDQIQTFYPQLMDDGRICFTRWEYQDRSASGQQQLYAMGQDGSHQTGLFADNSEWPFALIHCRGIPGSEKLIAINGGHHVAQKGKVVVLDPTEGDDYESQTYDPAKSVYGMNTNDIVYTDFPGGALTVRWTPYDNPCGPAVTNMPGMYYTAGSSMDARPGMVPAKYPKDYHYNVYDMHAQYGPQWAYPFALDEEHYLVSYMPEGCRYHRGPYSSRFGVYAVDKSGRRELLAFDWGNHSMQPIPLRARPEVARRPEKKVDYTRGFGVYYVYDVYNGAAAEGLKRGSVKRIRVIALEYRPVHNGWNWQFGWHSSQGKIGTPIAVGNGCYDVKHVLGEAEVEEDGSCMFSCPVRTPVYFQLIDGDGLCLQTMRSWSTLMPGEANSCVGCHEHPNDAAPSHPTIASRKPPQKLQSAIPGKPRHPLLDRWEKEGPIASLENWMGVNRPLKADPAEIAAKGIPAEERGDGIGFVKDIQPIFDRLLRDYPNEKILGIDMRDVPARLPATDDRSMRVYSEAYLQFTAKGMCTDNLNFASGLSFAAFKPPCSFGAIRSKWYHALVPYLTDAERRTIAMWIDLAIPYCSCYTERHTWDAWHQQRYLYTYDKRIFSYWLELDEIRRSLGLPSVPLTGFVPNVTEPKKQKRWFD